MKNGVVYIATEGRHLDDARVSAASLKAIHPDLPVALYSDRPAAAGCFDRVIVVGDLASNLDKARCLVRSPFERTLYLDADTFVCGDLSGVFAVLDRFDLAAAHDLVRLPPTHARDPWKAETAGIPAAFCQLNGGVIAFRKCPRVDRFLADWTLRHERDRRRGVQLDQPSLRELAFAGGLALWVLPPEYNCQIPWRGYLAGPARIVHGHAPGLLPAIAALLARNPGRKVFAFERGRLTVMYQEGGERRTLRIEPALAGLRRRIGRRLG
jgi:hypothetical protein